MGRRAIRRTCGEVSVGLHLAKQVVMSFPSYSFEKALGRSAAALCHPVAAWRVQALGGRAYLVSAYTLIGYATVLSVLLLKG